MCGSVKLEKSASTERGDDDIETRAKQEDNQPHTASRKQTNPRTFYSGIRL